MVHGHRDRMRQEKLRACESKPQSAEVAQEARIEPPLMPLIALKAPATLNPKPP